MDAHSETFTEEINYETLNLINRKGVEVDIQVNILKYFIDAYSPILTKIINSSTEQNESPNELKLTETRLLSRKKNTKENYNNNKGNYNAIRLVTFA